MTHHCIKASEHASHDKLKEREKHQRPSDKRWNQKYRHAKNDRGRARTRGITRELREIAQHGVCKNKNTAEMDIV